MMGNSSSASDNEDDTTSHDSDDNAYDDLSFDGDSSDTTSDSDNIGPKEDTVFGNQKTEGEEDNGPHHCTDLGQLFDHKNLRRFASKLKDYVPVNVVQQNHSHLVRWLETALGRNEETVTLSQFCDFLMSRSSSIEREKAFQAFSQFDAEGDGTADTSAMLEALKSCSGPNLHGELKFVIRTLQACTLVPGFIDVYSEDKISGAQHGSRILNFLMRNRATSDALPFPVLDGFNNTTFMRQAVLQSTFSKLTDTVNKQLNENLLGNGTELRPITKTYTRIDVSTNTADASRLTNGDFSSYWQSDGLARSHWIRLWMKNNVVLKQLSIAVSSADQSYMPQLVSVAVGKSPNNLVELKEVRIPSHVKGDFPLVENLQTFYRCIQITIRRCQSDGCDTRIRGIKTLGYKIVKDQGFSVLDASAIWYLQVLASTVGICRTLAPGLRLSVLEHSKNALRHMPPLSLSNASSTKPSFLSTHVLDEIEKFLADVTVDDQNQLGSCGVHVLLSLSLARGHVASILKILETLIKNSNLTIPCGSLFKSMVKVQETFCRKSANPIQMTLLGCDGGTKEDNSPPNLVLTGNWMAPAQFYQSKEGKTKVNMFFKGPSDIQLIKLQIKVEKGARGPKTGMVFVYRDSEKEFELDKLVERFAKYDSWNSNMYDELESRVKTGGQRELDDPIGFFTVEEEWDEVEAVLDEFPVGQNVLVKFLEPRQSTADRLGIVGVKFYGFLKKNYQPIEFEKEKLMDESSDMSSHEVVQKTLLFLKDIACEQPVMKRGVCTKKQWLDMNKLTIETVWLLYKSYLDTFGGDDVKMQCLTLQLLHSLLPHIAATKQMEKVEVGSFFQHLCSILDKDTKDEKRSTTLIPIVRQVVVDGVSIFFPDKEARRKELFGMIENISGGADTPPSVQLIFQSLCQFYSSVDPTGLLDLPKTLDSEFDPEKFLTMMETLCEVVLREFKLFLDTNEMTDQSCHLLSLVSSLQTSLLAWCQRQVTVEDKERQEDIKKNKKIIEPLLVRYSQMVITKAHVGLKFLEGIEEKELQTCVEKMEKSFFSTAVRQLILLLSSLSKQFHSASSVQLVRGLLAVAEEIKKISMRAPSLFEHVKTIDLENLKTSEVLLRNWSVESPHNYHNNQHSLQTFFCPGAAKFVVDFDVRCETEKRYDYLEFTDARGYKVQYDQKVGSDKWQKQVQFRGPYLQFLFHSDSSTTEWGYKFTVQAKGSPDQPLCWLYDLQLGLTKLMGQLCSETLDCKNVIPRDELLQDDHSQKESTFLKSELWTALFRGGYRIGKLQRSLSGKFGALDVDSEVHRFLGDVTDKEGDLAKAFLEKCQEQCHSLRAGGEAIDDVVVRVFTALLWHTQALRDELAKYLEAEGDMTLSEGITQAYTAAESVRNFILDLRQKKKLAQEKENSKEEAVDYVELFREKAEYLLKFAGLTKIPPKTEMRVKTVKIFKKTSVNRKMSAGMLERQQSVFETSVSEKYPSFRLVLDFIRDPSVGKEKVHELLQERCRHAQSVATVYDLASEFIKASSDPHIFQIPTVMFLTELLRNQNHFAKHYADGIEGAGLELESQVRKAYYTLLKRLVEPLETFDRNKAMVGEVSAFDFIRACLLHLLDVNWQPYDYSFILKAKIPDLFMNVAKGSVATRSRGSGDYKEEVEMKAYEQNMKWFSEAKGNFHEWHKNCEKTDKQAFHMFIARFCDLLEVEISCDGCHVTLPGRRYRCLQCQDVDLCTTCFAGGVTPGVGEHKEDHEMVHLMFKCDACGAFIVGQRVHCDVCDDFDLCYGCHVKENVVSGHTGSHSVTKYPMVTLTSNKKCDSTLQAYIHQHVWLLFTSLTLNMADIVYSQPAALDADYLETASQIHNMCTTLVTNCLEQVPLSDQLLHEDSLVEDPEKSGKREVAFALHSQERIMGLLGAMIPAEHVPFSFHTEKFLKLLFMVARGESGHEVNTQHLAMGLLCHLLKRVTTTCKVCDKAVSEATSTTIEEGRPEGWHTIKYLFDFGAKCLERSSVEWAYSVSAILQGLFNSPIWQKVLMDFVKGRIATLTDSQELSSVFALIVVAGFPDVLSVGTIVKCTYTMYGMDSKNSVVLKHFPEKMQTLVVDMATRRRHMVEDDLVDVTSLNTQILDEQHVTSLINIVKTVAGKLMQDDIQGVSPESLWVLGLSLKALIKSGCIGNGKDNPVYETDFVQCIVHLASRGTDFEKLWLLKDLEVLSLMLYTADKQQKTLPPPPAEKSTPPQPEESKPEAPAKEQPPAPNIRDEMESAAKDTIELLSGYAQVLQATLNPLAEILDENQTSATDLLRELARKDYGNQNNEGASVMLPDELQTVLSKTMNIMSKLRNHEAPSSTEADKTLDTGIDLFGTSTADLTSEIPSEAVDEPCEKSQDLVAVPDNDVKRDVEKQRKHKSADLMKKALEAQGKTMNREYLTKVNLAIAILHAREVLISLLADWPAGDHVITAQLLGCNDSAQIPCVIDMLNRTESKDTINKLVQNLVRSCEPSCLIATAMTTCNFLEELSLMSVSKESEHPYKNNTSMSDKVVIPGASFLSIKFDKRCVSEETCDDLVISTSADFKQNKHTFSGTKDRWIDFELPGDTLHFKFTSDCSNNDWGFKFIVTGGKTGRFDTGYMILNAILSKPERTSLLPLDKLWVSLLQVVCKQTGVHRLKIIQLLLHILHTQFRDGHEFVIDLCLLKPMWQLYCKISTNFEPGTIISPLVRALTELFFVAENLALANGIAEKYAASLKGKEEWEEIILEGLTNIGAISTAIGYSNQVTEHLKAVKTEEKKAGKSKEASKTPEKEKSKE